MTLQGRLVDGWNEGTQAGDYWFDVDATHLLFCCPCGCGELGALQLRRDPVTHPSWQWDGDRERPTLDPSIQRNTGCRWHGFLRAGVWESC